MKKLFAAILLIVVSTALMLGWRTVQNYAPDIPPETFDASRCKFSNAPQEIKLKPHNRDWILRAIRSYTADGILEDERFFQFDENGRPFYMYGDTQVDGSALGYGSSKYDDDMTRFLETWDVQEERFDDFGRILYREGYQPRCSEGTHIFEQVGYVYCPGEPASDVMDSLCVFTRTMGIRFDTPEDSIIEIRDPETDERIGWRLEDTSYEIDNFDRYGNKVVLWIESDGCCLLENADGYLKTVISNTSLGYMVHQVDPSGRPLWYAWYDKQDGSLIRYTIWEYEELEREG